LLDTLLTPVLFWLFGEKATKRLVRSEPDATPAEAPTQEAF
jgi:HME family heavy-metal exporter